MSGRVNASNVALFEIVPYLGRVKTTFYLFVFSGFILRTY